MIQSSVLRCAEQLLPDEATTDASYMLFGVIITQTDVSGCRSVVYTSKKLNEAEKIKEHLKNNLLESYMH